ncbi:hypothetical protein EV361DRAFT_954941 [Lentinula raphanica]|nr:hypothetical protein F5880DRAFT_1618275 [Lentinula raphanica]KAJ3965504.1 hypothetical protein EV361DRAFT_954941 [Lentinula raphanica]
MEGPSSGVITSGLLNLGTEQNKVDAIRATVNRGNNLDNDHVVNAPTLEVTPIQEDAPGYIARVFPTLFPNGGGDYHTPRMQKVDMGEYFDHLMRIHDGRFAQHRRFPWFTFNMLQRRRSLGAAKVYVRQAHDAYGMTVAEIQNLVNEGEESIAQNTMDVQLSLRYSKISSTLLMVTPETIHPLLGIPLVRPRFSFTPLNLSKDGAYREVDTTTSDDGERGMVTGLSWIQRYMDRAPELDSLSTFEICERMAPRLLYESSRVSHPIPRTKTTKATPTDAQPLI